MGGFCWYTSYIGYPNFLKESGNSYELAQAFVTFCDAAFANKSYKESKELFPSLVASQVETKKAAFQEYGLLYVIPRSDKISITPLGKQIYSIYKDDIPSDKKRRRILLALCNAMANYQFNNPFPVGGNKYRDRAFSTDVKPYLSLYFLMSRLDGFITISELMGVVFGIKRMADVPVAEQKILNSRESRIKSKPLNHLPKNKGTAENLKIYFMSHLSLDGEIIVTEHDDIYEESEQAYEMTQFGSEIIETVLRFNWSGWKKRRFNIPETPTFLSIEEYFENGIGRQLSKVSFRINDSFSKKITQKKTEAVADIEDIENLKKFPLRKFEEGRNRLVKHLRIEKVRNPALVKEAKQIFKIKNGRLFCEACDFEFEKQYGNRGKNYIEAHHNSPLSEIKGRVALTIKDLSMVCSNCHRMLHKPPWISVKELRDIVCG